jgi:hypothetical protein
VSIQSCYVHGRLGDKAIDIYNIFDRSRYIRYNHVRFQITKFLCEEQYFEIAILLFHVEAVLHIPIKSL